jgi:hypothetical protein
LGKGKGGRDLEDKGIEGTGAKVKGGRKAKWKGLG